MYVCVFPFQHVLADTGVHNAYGTVPRIVVEVPVKRQTEIVTVSVNYL